MTLMLIKTQTNGLFELAGDLTFATISKKTVLLCDFKSIDSPVVSFDFSQINNSDSAGLALLIEWIKLSHNAQREIKFYHLPEQLLTLAKLGGFDMQPYLGTKN